MAIFAAGASVGAQTVSPPQVVSGPEEGSVYEPAVVASPQAPNQVLIEWIDRAQYRTVKYAVSNDWGIHYTSPQQLVFNMSDSCVQHVVDQADPMVAASRAGDLYGGVLALDSDSGGWFYVGRLPLGSSGSMVAVQASPCQVAHVDKGFLSIGPTSPTVTDEVMWAGYSIVSQPRRPEAQRRRL
jgi:hypothetical protein